MLLDEAVARTGLTDFGSRRFHDGLHRLVTALRTEARLNAAGRREARHTLLTALLNRLHLHSQTSPATARYTLPQEPVFIIGLPRTGSTFLQSLLNGHPDLRALRLWELLHPVTPPGIAQRRLISRTRRYVDDFDRAVPGFRRIHVMDAQAPDECERLMTTEFANTTMGLISYQVPSYASWVLQQDLTDAYRGHWRQLGAIMARAPGGTPLLKCPSHIWHLPALSAVYPRAKLIILHRDPLQAIASTCSLTLNVRRKRTDHVDPREIGAQISRAGRVALDRLLAFRTDPPAQLTAIDIDFDELCAAPAEVAERIFRFLNLPVDRHVRRACQTFLEQRPRDRHGVHRYAPETYGLSADLDGRFTAYRDQFLQRHGNAVRG
ncbi:sulfotransferase [Actinomadura cremea]|nr:sulfotransferase [Actinomadura cremea]